MSNLTRKIKSYQIKQAKQEQNTHTDSTISEISYLTGFSALSLSVSVCVQHTYLHVGVHVFLIYSILRWSLSEVVHPNPELSILALIPPLANRRPTVTKRHPTFSQNCFARPLEHTAPRHLPRQSTSAETVETEQIQISRLFLFTEWPHLTRLLHWDETISGWIYLSFQKIVLVSFAHWL